jgi:hypothetical protein
VRPFLVRLASPAVCGVALCLGAAAWIGGPFQSSGSVPRLTGYLDTPFLPGSQWRVHDAERPRPAHVIPGRVGTQERSGSAPSDALVLFEGRSLGAWQQAGKPGEPALWELREGVMVVNGTGSIETRVHFADFQLHLEWRSPAEPSGECQGRGNSGVFLMGRYEVQVLDSYNNETYADGQAAALYGQLPPLVNSSRGPGEWQRYDIIFRAPRFAEGELVEPARVTLFHNGVLVHYDRAFIGATAHREVGRYSEHPPAGPILLQDHGSPVEFRNIWIRPFEGPWWRGD